MIKQIENKTEVFFANGNDGTITVTTHPAHQMLTLQEIGKPAKVGDNIPLEDLKPLPKVDLHFYNTRSIDVVIQALQAIKRQMERGNYDYALAC